MIPNNVKPLRFTKAALLKGNPIGQETTTFSELYSPDVTFAQLYTHEITEIGMVISGSGTHRILNEAIPCREGDIYILHPDTPHGYFASEESSELVVRRLWFDPSDWFEGELAAPEKSRFCYGVFSDSGVTAYAMLTASTREEINRLLDDIALEFSEKRSEWRDAVRAHLSMLLITVKRYVGNAIKNLPDVSPKEWAMVSSTVKLVTERFGDCELTLEVIASSMFISKSHLSRVFRRVTGDSFADYIKSVRFNNACRLLRETKLTVDETARQCGLRDIPSFYRSFNVLMGMTPNQYRASFSQKINSNNKAKGEKTMDILNDISVEVQKGRSKLVKSFVEAALEEKIPVEQILNDGLLKGMSIIGEKFKNNEVYVPEILVAARAMKMGTELLKPYFAESGITATGRVCLGTVQGDLHDIGKNLVKMMLEGKGLEVIDLGTDVAPETFIKSAIENDCQVICCSALLTTTMGVMEDVVKAAEEAGIRDKVKIMIGGAPVNQEFCDKIGADAYTTDAASAADAAVSFCAN